MAELFLVLFLATHVLSLATLSLSTALVPQGAPKKAAGKNEKYINTQLAAAVLELKEP